MPAKKLRVKLLLSFLLLTWFCFQEVLGLEFPWELKINIEEVGGDVPFMNYPVGLFVDHEKQTIWVSDWGNNRVLVFDRQGRFLRALNGLQGPVGLAKRGGKLFVVEQKGNQVKIFDAEKLALIGSLKPTSGSFREPRGIWIDEAGNIYVADTGNSRIIVFRSSGEEIASIGKEGMGDGEFYYPRGVVVDEEGLIWVVDTAHNCIQVLDRTGKFLFRFGQGGEGEGDFHHPRYIFVRGDFVFISDYRNHRIKIYDRKGSLLAIIGGKEGVGALEFSYPEGVWVDEEGFLWVADAGNSRIKAIDVAALLQPKKHLLSLAHRGEEEEFFALWQRLSPQERRDPEVAEMVFEFLQRRGDIEGMITQAEELFMSDEARRDHWKKMLGKLYYEKGNNLKQDGDLQHARELYAQSFKRGYLPALFTLVWTSFLLVGGSNLLLLFLALILLVLLVVFYRLKVHRRRW